jgi:drug/metabolite transporter superfamily protein YnfA
MFSVFLQTFKYIIFAVSGACVSLPWRPPGPVHCPKGPYRVWKATREASRAVWFPMAANNLYSSVTPRIICSVLFFQTFKLHILSGACASLPWRPPGPVHCPKGPYKAWKATREASRAVWFPMAANNLYVFYVFSDIKLLHHIRGQ